MHVEVAETRKRQLLTEMFNAALSAVHPYQAVKRTLRREDNKLHVANTVYALDSFDRVIVVGAGNATALMAAAVEEVLGRAIDSGTIIVKQGRTAALNTLAQIEAAHPLPDSAAMQGTQKILDMLRGVDARTLVICLLSGGASALLVKPMPGICLEHKQKSIDLLLRAGASVYELNAVLKNLSDVKGGRLARAAYPATVLTLTLSDVIGDRIDVIGSGPTAPGNATFCEAAAIVEKYELRYKLPAEVVALLERGTRGREPQTAESGEACFDKARSVIVGGLVQALFSAGARARSSGYAADVLLNEVQRSSRETARVLAKKALRMRDVLAPGERRCLLFGGESTATADGNGKGGRNQELALAFAQEIAGIPGIMLLSAGTHGTDGSTDAAGAVVDGATTSYARQRGMHPQSYLDNNDTYTFFKKIELSQNKRQHVITGRTGANMMDVQIVLLEG